MGSARAELRPLPARVVWSRDTTVYVVSPDSTALSAGMTLEFSRGRRRLATGSVLRKLDSHVALARLDSGSLAGERRLERVQIRGEAGAVVRPHLLRLGFPGRERANLLFRCTRTGVHARFAGADYLTDTLPGGALRLRRATAGPEDGTGLAVPESPIAPDTLDVRFYSDAADQEIALERGELDVAVFWPGELSPRLRSDARWRDAPRGLRARGVLAAVMGARDSLRVRPEALAALDREAFAGDLLAWRELEPPAWPAADEAAARFLVDPTLPGARVLERVLERAGGVPVARAVRLVYLDVPVAAGDAVQAGWRTRDVQPLFALRCPVLVAPRLRDLVAGLGGADAFANLLRCERSAP